MQPLRHLMKASTAVAIPEEQEMEYMNESEAPGNPFALDVQIVPEPVGVSSRACTTNDGCAPSCASSCTSSSC